jgi:CoA:oxalate CoA-transferase
MLGDSQGSAALPLSGVMVVDLVQVHQGLYCSLLMAGAGAEVIKIEPWGGGSTRRRASVPRG